jgi:hypothetical protein
MRLSLTKIITKYRAEDETSINEEGKNTDKINWLNSYSHFGFLDA